MEIEITSGVILAGEHMLDLGEDGLFQIDQLFFSPKSGGFTALATEIIRPGETKNVEISFCLDRLPEGDPSSWDVRHILMPNDGNQWIDCDISDW